MLIKTLIAFGMPEKWAYLLGIAGPAIPIIWSVFIVYNSFVGSSEKLDAIESNQIEILRESREIKEINYLLVSCIADLSSTNEAVTEKLITIIKESSEQPVNIQLIQHVEDEIKEIQKNNLPHHKIKKDSITYTIKVKKWSSHDKK